MKSISGLGRARRSASTIYVLTDRLHRDRSVRVSADEIVDTVSGWLAQLGVCSPLVEDFGRTVCNGDWIAAYALADVLSVDVTVAA